MKKANSLALLDFRYSDGRVVVYACCVAFTQTQHIDIMPTQYRVQTNHELTNFDLHVGNGVASMFLFTKNKYNNFYRFLIFH